LRRFDDLSSALDLGNSVVSGLTAGIFSQDPEELRYFTDNAHAGALYINRPMGATTGAWPGIQSLCGWKASGLTGKGGLGPHYLPQFMREQCVTEIVASSATA
jgi:1-pyrroline-5-carboxylate dehydrogenase